MSSPPPLFLYEGAPPTPFNPSILPYPYTGISNLPDTKGLPSHCCQARPSFATYAYGAIDSSRYTPWLGVQYLGITGWLGHLMLFFQWGCNHSLLFQSFCQLPHRFPELILIVGSKLPRLHWSVVSWTSQGTATPGSCQQEHLDSVKFSFLGLKLWDGWVAPSLDKEPCLSTEGDLYSFYLPLLCGTLGK